MPVTVHKIRPGKNLSVIAGQYGFGRPLTPIHPDVEADPGARRLPGSKASDRSLFGRGTTKKDKASKNYESGVS